MDGARGEAAAEDAAYAEHCPQPAHGTTSEVEEVKGNYDEHYVQRADNEGLQQDAPYERRRARHDTGSFEQHAQKADQTGPGSGVGVLRLRSYPQEQRVREDQHEGGCEHPDCGATDCEADRAGRRSRERACVLRDGRPAVRGDQLLGRARQPRQQGSL